MGEETSDTMNLDLNLGPGPEARTGSIPNEVVNLDDWVDDPIDRIREAVRSRSRQRWRWRQVQIPPENRNLPMELDQLLGHSPHGSMLQAGEGSVAAEERTNDVPKTCENNNGFLEDEVSEKKDDVEKGSGNDGSFFDCNICLDLARDPVVTCCGHLFCWPCLYRWLHVHSDAKECPVCKGEVIVKNVTPIYGRGNITREPEEDSSLKIPLRPHARRVESLRQTIQRTALSFPVEEMIRRLGSRFDLARDSPPRDGVSGREPTERANSLISRILTSRGMRGEQNPVSAPPDDVDSVQSGSNGTEGEARWLHSLLLRRQAQAHRGATIPSSVSSTLSSAERYLEAYFRTHHIGRNQEQPSPPVDDRDSFSSIAAVINSESQLDTAVEIDSMVSLSTSSSRRRSDSSRVSDMDSGDSRAPRRRRLN
ncbi:E3 ubiquitin-protein ligase RNF5 [Melia azedarach]|uniref:E3 ubiquitin-protein ligase RNF5 n=2 Tax=Melia azedarach TaxID=155640 RepID=A0ACC1X268_MELAZ|nr:E3 ubiquitin-protein ligase RNF5 [Melia azedarach]KAJ4705550.1 E3 ubiquitin-protein ligase RNF5 [Melia azedarach]